MEGEKKGGIVCLTISGPVQAYLPVVQKRHSVTSESSSSEKSSDSPDENSPVPVDCLRAKFLNINRSAYLPVVQKRHSVTSESSSSEKSSESPDENSPVPVDCLRAKFLNINRSGVKTRCQNEAFSEPISKRLRSAL
ncbi:unnamed protein product [Gongylonema pulchrum]|uniref:Synaptonemal complex protein 2 n=1 Tax=Gongylonema pulchrum TaxID=637853 RepID=A0A183ECX7_9BILA|nr:unnamed protein product [Gongylonema pulchrum]